MIDSVFRKYEMEYLGWPSIVGNLESILQPEDLREFQKLYRQFNSYKSDELLTKMYDFIFKQHIQYHVNCHRIPRLRRIWQALRPHLNHHQALLDVGAGTGILSETIRETLSLEIHHVTDLSDECERHLFELGFDPYSQFIKYDFLLMADVLGEVNIDEDDVLTDLLGKPGPGTGELIEERYGFAHKLGGWKNALAPRGKIFLIEPFNDGRFFGHLRTYLESRGWQAAELNDAEGADLGLCLSL